MLLMLQGAHGHVASYRTWQRIPAVDGGTCQVRKGEHGLTILAPMTVTRRDIDEATGDEIVVAGAVSGFRPVKVFHQGQLVAPPDLPEPPLPTLLTGDNRWQHVWAAVVAQLADDRLPRRAGHTARPVETWNGRTDFADRPRRGRATTSNRPQRLKTLLHEWAHIALAPRRPRPPADPRRCWRSKPNRSPTCCAPPSAWTQPATPSPTSPAGPAATPTLARSHRPTGPRRHRRRWSPPSKHELSIDLTPDLLTVAETTDTTGEPTPNEQAGRAQHHTIVDEPSLATADPDIDRARGDLRRALTNLPPSERRLLVDTLDRLDHDLDIATALCADAGLDAAATSRLLIPSGADPVDLHRSMTRPVQDHHGDHAPLFPDTPDITPSLVGGHRDHHRHDPASESSRSPAEAILDQWANLASPHPTQTVQT